MKVFTSVKDLGNPNVAIKEALEIKRNRFAYKVLGENKTLLMVFFNSSLRTRLSTQKAAMNLGMNTILLDVNQGAWRLETERGVVMDGDKTEHILEAIPVMGSYCDIIGVRSFAQFESKEDDYNEKILNQFIQYSGRPVFSMEGATTHPMQAFADFMNEADVDFVITHPEGYELDPQFVRGAKIEYNQNKAFEGADFIYAKNWSPFQDANYGQVINKDMNWMVDTSKMNLTNSAFFMHCLPVRRNMIVSDEVIESSRSIVIQEAANREISCEWVLKKMLESL
jgi:N-succinyl-L-ornithine transcarbamylase